MAFDFQAAYDELNPADDDYRFYASLAAELQAMDVIDLGCGTGTLARLLTAAGHHVVAIDPDPEMLRVAAAKGPIDNVTWRQGFSDCADTDSADLFVMSGHVAQVFVGDDEWLRVLHDARRALRRGGMIAFESRNPDARGWEMWTRENSLRVVEESDGPVEFWHSTVEASLPTVVYDTWTADPVTGLRSCTRDTLTFRTLGSLTTTLAATGFRVRDVFGTWSRAPVAKDAPELIVLAEAR